MKKFSLLSSAACVIGVAMALGSCAYDTYAAGGGGYYDGYGYGSGYSTSLFVSTGDSRWGYDPYCNSYYDYTRRCYYDPYLYGYYPAGYRPRPVHGVPHPGGWRPGKDYCPPPGRVRDTNLSNYRDRENAYRHTSYSWAKNVREDNRPDRNGSGRDGPGRRPGQIPGYQGGAGPDRQSQSGNGFQPGRRPQPESGFPGGNGSGPRSRPQTPPNLGQQQREDATRRARIESFRESQNYGRQRTSITPPGLGSAPDRSFRPPDRSSSQRVVPDFQPSQRVERSAPPERSAPVERSAPSNSRSSDRSENNGRGGSGEGPRHGRN